LAFDLLLASLYRLFCGGDTLSQQREVNLKHGCTVVILPSLVGAADASA
jgi:hypothetical protein